MRPYCVYWWHAPFYDFIKVGYGFAPEERMIRYAEKYEIPANPSSLRHCVMRSRLAAWHAEQRLHQLLPTYGLEKFEWDARSGRGTAQEFFDLGNNGYGAVDWLIRELLEEVVSRMPTDATLMIELMTEERVRMAARIAEARVRLARMQGVPGRSEEELDSDIPF